MLEVLDALVVLFPGCVYAEVGPAITLLAPHLSVRVATPDGRSVRVEEGLSIQAAVNAATDGDTILVGAGHYHEQVTVDGLDITIKGAGEGQTFIDSPAAADLVANVIDAASGRPNKYALVGVKNDADLTISGINVASYGIDSFSYDPVTFTATWVLASYINTDLLTFTLSDAVVDVADGLALDGDWANGSSEFPSGDGESGGDFVFGVRVLPGDIDRFGTVDLSDLNYVRNHFGETTTDIFGDVSGNGSIELGDLNTVRNHFGESAVSIPPAPLR